MKRLSDELSDELTKFEILIIDHRIDEINLLLDDENLDDDIHDNLIDELEHYKVKLKKSLKVLKIRQSGFIIV